MYKFASGFTPIYEISNERTISGRRKIKAVLHEVHPDTNHYQENGISWNEEYTRNNLQSVIGMSVVAEFINDERDMPYGHGMSDIRDNLPLFEDATMVGHFDNAYIDDIVIDGELKRVLIAEGTLDEMRYPKFVEWLKDHMETSSIKGSVEIVGKPENDRRIIYAGGWKEKGRVPMFYDYSGYAILSIPPADNSAIIMEVNSKEEKKKEGPVMDEKMLQEITTAVTNAVNETNAKNAEFETRIEELNNQVQELQGDLEAKNTEISSLNETIAQRDADIEAKANELSEANSKIEALMNEKALNELNSALARYTDEQKDFAKEDIEAFTANPGSVEINSIVGKICTEIVRRAHEENSKVEIDVFSMTESQKAPQVKEVNVF